MLRFIYEELKRAPIVGVKCVAEFLGVSSPSAHQILDRLASKNLLIRIRGKGYVLSERGRSTARRIVISHRVLEIVFCKLFGMSAECACELASYIDFLIESRYAERALRVMKHPPICPHNKAIPIGDLDE